jgi:branched-chain amino acid transport system permease protein
MNKQIGYGIVLAAALVAPLLVYPVFLMKLLCFALYACAFNLLIGFSGLLSFGHAAFFGGAGYVAGYALKELGVPVEIGLLLGTLFGAAVGFLIGGIAIRRQGIYFTMITLALAQMFYFLYLQAPFTGGEDGLQGVPRGKLFGIVDLGDDRVLYYVVLAIAVAGFALIIRTIHSPFGRVLTAIKENEPRAVSLGYDVSKYKLVAFVLSAALTALAGATKTLVLGFETLTDAHWSMSGLVVLMTLVGGLGTIAGPVIGAVVIIVLENKLGAFGNFLAAQTGVDWFNSVGESVTTVIGLVFIVCVLAFRRGILGEAAAYIERLKAKNIRDQNSAASTLEAKVIHASPR